MKHSKLAGLAAKWVIIAGAALASSACSSLPFHRAGQTRSFAYDVKKLEAPQPPTIARTSQPHADSAHRSVNLWERLRQGMALETVESPATDKYLAYYASHPDFINRVFLKAAPFLDYILTEVENRNMPSEIALLPFIESGFDPLAVSRTGARGLWQFTASTGKYYRLRQTGAYDARSDVVSSTRAALTYLQDLYLDMHDNWLLALAAYNGGPGYVKNTAKRDRLRLGTARFTDLVHLRRETRNYVPKLIAIARIIQDPQAYGVKLPDMSNEKIITVRNFDYPVDLRQIARQTGVSLNTLRALNPGIRKNTIHGHGHLALALPRNQLPDATGAIQTASADAAVVNKTATRRAAAPATSTAPQTVSSNVYSPAQTTYSSSRHELTRKRVQPVHAGVVTASKSSHAAAAKAISRHHTAALQNYHIRSGDTLSRIALKYATSVAILKKINHLKGSLILAGATLKVPGSLPTESATIATAADKPAASHERRHVIYRVGEGDTLAAIARHYGVYDRDIARWNALSDGTPLQPGAILTIYPSEKYFVQRSQSVLMVRLKSYSFPQASGPGHDTTASTAMPLTDEAAPRPVVKYRVGPGDTLEAIARHYRIPANQLAAWNDLRGDISVGQTIEIPPSI